jgi:hypothetical protein
MEFPEKKGIGSVDCVLHYVVRCKSELKDITKHAQHSLIRPGGEHVALLRSKT